MISLNRLVFDPASPADTSNVGAYVRAGTDGDLIGSVSIDGNESLNVNISATFLEDSAAAGGERGVFMLGIRQDADTSPVSNDGDFHPFVFDENGRLKVVADIEVSNGFEKVEDTAHASGDVGGYVLSVIQGTLSASAADGDYGSFKTDLLGRLYTNHSAQSAAYGSVTISSTSTDIVATDLSNRTKIIVQNISNKDVYLGSNASVTSANGIRLSPGSSIELEVGPSIDLHAITTSGTADVRYFEVA